MRARRRQGTKHGARSAAGRPCRKCADALSCQNAGNRRKQTAAGITRMTRRIICLGASSALLVDGLAPTPQPISRGRRNR